MEERPLKVKEKKIFGKKPIMELIHISGPDTEVPYSQEKGTGDFSTGIKEI